MGARIFGWLYLHRKLAWALVLAPFVYWAFDRAPPFRMVFYHEPAPVHAGEEVYISADVKRDVDRNCSAQLNRNIVDSNGISHHFGDRDTTAPMALSSQSISAQDAREPNVLHRAFVIPKDIPPGRTVITTDLAYSCGINPIHKLWPIRIYLEWPFTVLPPEPPAPVPVTIVNNATTPVPTHDVGASGVKP